VFLLSREEVNQYLTTNSARVATNVNGEASSWWLRDTFLPSPAPFELFAYPHAYLVEDNGRIGSNGNYPSEQTNRTRGIRPALWLYKDS